MNNYGWSKLGAESAVQMYKNSLILRITMTSKPFAYKKVFTNLKTNFMLHISQFLKTNCKTIIRGNKTIKRVRTSTLESNLILVNNFSEFFNY